MCASNAWARLQTTRDCAPSIRKRRRPSTSEPVTRQFYKCFGCGVGGDVIKFVQEIEGLSFWESAKMLAERHGVPLPKRSDYSDAESKQRGALMDMHAIAARLFQDNLRGVRRALEGRGPILPNEAFRRK